MLRAQNLTKHFGDQPILEDASFLMNPGERLGLVGRNGSGKTTIFRMIIGEEDPDDGQLILPRNYRVGHLSQHLSFTEPTVLTEACTALRASEDGAEQTYRAEAALMGLGFSREDLDRPPSEFSGGYQIRINLAKVLISEPNLLLLDEPTNYLDIVSVRWLRQFLRAWPGELITISHDRDFLKQVTTHTMMIHRRGLRRVEGHVEKLIEQIATEEEVYEKTRLNEAKKRKQEERFIERFRYKASKAKAVQSRIKAIERRGDLEALDHERNLEFSFRDEPFHAPTVLKANDLSFGYEDGPNLVEDFAVEVAKDDRIAVIGRNGKGKTTLLNLLAGELTPRTGSITLHPSAKPAYFGQTNIDRLDPESTVEDEILAVHPEHSVTAARGICGLVLFEGDQALKKVSVLSGGERSRVLLGKILVSPTNLLLLDEPTNHLDLESVESLLDAIDAFEGAVLLVTHSEMILERVANRLIIFDRGRVRLFEGTYRDFLDRVGWEGEDADKPAPSSTPKISAKDRRRLRAEIVAERSKATSTLRKKVEELENQIVTLEADVEAHNAELIELATGADPERMAAVGKLSKDKTAAIETAFEELEAASETLAELEATFESRLAELVDE